jgi:hypothetical protein
VPAGGELEAEEPRAAARIEHIEPAATGQNEIENAVPRGALCGSADAVSEILVKMRRPPPPMRGDLLFHRVRLN